VQTTLRLRDLHGATGVRLQPLDGRGQPWGEARDAVADDGGFVLELDEQPGTTWYLVEVLR
jgi:hypothetical protein